jgi:hypothetical protein
MEIGEVGELFVDVISNQRTQSRPQEAWMVGQVLGTDLVGEQQQRSFGPDFPDCGNRRPHERDVLAHEREPVSDLRVELLDSLNGEPALKGVKPRRARARFVLTRNPGENLDLAGANAAPQTG